MRNRGRSLGLERNLDKAPGARWLEETGYVAVQDLLDEEIEASVEESGFEETVALVKKAKVYVKTREGLPSDTKAWLEGNGSA